MIKTAAISTIKCPFDELVLFVNYHLNIGIDKIILFFDDPDDKGISFFENNENVICTACNKEYWLNKQKNNTPFSLDERLLINVNEGVEIARKLNCTWIIQIDGDELIYSKENIASLLENTTADAVRLSILEAVSEKEEYETIFQPSLFKIKSGSKKIKLAKALGCNQAIYNNEYFRGHTASKMFVKISPKIRQYGNHRVKEHEGTLDVITSKKIILLHYDCVGINNWRIKWDARVITQGKANNMRTNRIQQYKEYESAQQLGENAQKKLFTRMHCINNYEKLILFMLRMLRVIKLDISVSSR